MKPTKLIILISLIFTKVIGQTKDENTIQKEIKKPHKKTEIVFIFKKQNPEKVSDNSVTILGSAIYYSEKNNFTAVELNPNNRITSDTIVKAISSDEICLSHTYNKTQKFLYVFQKGDTIVFDYEKGYPYASVMNRKTLKFDSNFIADTKIEKPLDDFEYTAKNKRIRNTSENKVYFKELKDYRIEVDKILDSLLKENLISKSNYEMHKASIRFYEINTNKSFLTSTINDDLKRDDLLYLKTYRHFLNNYVVERFKLKTQFSSDPMSCNSKIAFDSILKSSIFSKKVTENLLYAHLVNIAENNPKADLNLYFKKFQEAVNDPLLNEKIKNNYSLEFTTLKKGIEEVYVTTLTKKKNTLENLIAENKGKVLFIDFWASWCAPCRAAMPSSRKLKDEYKGKEVVFFYVSIDLDFEKWENASEKEKLSKNENNLLALNYPDAIFYKELKLKSIPRYLIYDKKGKLVHLNAPSPETSEIREEFNKYLKE